MTPSWSLKTASSLKVFEQCEFLDGERQTVNTQMTKHTGRTILKGMTLIDGTKSDPKPHAQVVIEGERVVAVAQSNEPIETRAGDRVMDLTGQFVIPGMYNLHDHVYRKDIMKVKPGWSYDEHSRAIERENDNYLVLTAAYHALNQLRSGVTTIRDVGERSNLLVSLRRAIDQGLVTGPRLKVAVKLIVMSRGHGYYMGREADGPDEIRKAAREQIKAGADFLKIIATGGLLGMPKEDPGNPQFTVEEIRAAADVAHNAGKRITAHADAAKGIQNAIEAGIDCIEHGAFLDEKTIDMMVKKDIPLVATISGMRGYAEYHRKAGNPAFADFVNQSVKTQHAESFRKAYSAGIRLGVGTDSATLVYDEIQDMHGAGMSLRDCVVAATSISSQIVGINRDVGTLEPGKLADLVVLGSDPHQRIEAFIDTKWVMKGGDIIEPHNPIL
jgi:imidazolonepropionase-like amidohydrolase